jgi:sulfate adenylyltransferase large subunit
MDLLRVATAGSVDDGKSTLIGRLLHDAGALLSDERSHDLAQLTDGLRAEREQGITIDVAHRSFATERRRFVLIDCPGHQQYTRNMLTGASTADAAVVLVDVRGGLTRQSRRHLAICALLGLRHVVVCVNKLDLVDWSEEAFDAVARDALEWTAEMGLTDLAFIPVSALRGDNIVERSANLPWYGGEPLLAHLEELPLDRVPTDVGARLPVQLVLRDPSGGPRRYAGRLAAGTLAVGDEIVVLPSGARTRIARLDTPAGAVDAASAPLSVSVALEDELDVGRGDLLASADALPPIARELAATVCWLGHDAVSPGARLALKHGTRTVPARLDSIDHRLDVETLVRAPANELALNDIGRVRLRVGSELAVDAYADSPATGAFILIDESTHDTVGAGMVG